MMAMYSFSFMLIVNIHCHWTVMVRFIQFKPPHDLHRDMQIHPWTRSSVSTAVALMERSLKMNGPIQLEIKRCYYQSISFCTSSSMVTKLSVSLNTVIRGSTIANKRLCHVSWTAGMF